jgi:hypothetical protein
MLLRLLEPIHSVYPSQGVPLLLPVDVIRRIHNRGLSELSASNAQLHLAAHNGRQQQQPKPERQAGGGLRNSNRIVVDVVEFKHLG